jgi:hypothetical protein
MTNTNKTGEACPIFMGMTDFAKTTDDKQTLIFPKFLIQFLSYFILNRDNRKIFRKTYTKI